jgi:ABC-type sugar transport system substrate-binding protein
MRATLVILTFALALPCVPAAAAGADEKAPQQRISVTYIRPTDELYYTCGFDGARMMAERLNVDLEGSLSEGKIDQEISLVQAAISRGSAGIILFPVSAASLAASLDAAAAAKVPVMALYGYSAELKARPGGSVQTDILQACTALGTWVAQNVAEGQVTCIMGVAGRGDAERYRDVFQREAEKNTKLKVVASTPGDWDRAKAKGQMQNLIASFPAMKAVFAENDDMALGALQALQEANKATAVSVVSLDGAPYGLESVAAGGIRATVSWSPSQEAQIALRLLAAQVRAGRTPPKLTLSPFTLVTKDTLSAAVPWQPTAASTDATLKLNLAILPHAFAQ